MVGQQADLSLPLLLLDSQFGSTVSVGAAAAEQDQEGPQEPEPWTQERKTSKTCQNSVQSSCQSYKTAKMALVKHKCLV